MMMKSAALSLAVVAGLLVAADNKEDAVKKDKASLKGSWAFVAIEGEGKKFPLPDADVRLVFDGDKVSLPSLLVDTTYVIDPLQKPATIDMKAAGGLRKGTTFKGIYVIDKDELKICFADDQRPSKFSSSDGTSTVLWILKRQK
jgi:uncharacterized protein (TIGR03067 family)